MRALTWLGFLMAFLLCTVWDLQLSSAATAQPSPSDTGVTRTPAAPEKVEVVSTPPPRPQVSEAVSKKCHGELRRAGSGPHRARGGSSAEYLEDLQDACVEILPLQLREGARQAIPLRGRARAKRLTEALRGLVPEECLLEPGTRALELPTHCHLPGRHGFSGKNLPPTIDAASHMFALTVFKQFLDAGATLLEADVQGWALLFALRSSIEWERHPEYFDPITETEEGHRRGAGKRPLKGAPE